MEEVMGLDVYFCKYENREPLLKAKEEYDRQEKRRHASVERAANRGQPKGKRMKFWELPAAKRKPAQEELQELAKSLGLDQYGDVPYERVEINSRHHPRHLFKIGYFRSSYNGCGFNNVVRDLTGKTLDWVFFGDKESPDEYEFQPDWDAARARARKARDELQAFSERYGTIGVTKEFVSNQGAKSHAEAIQAFIRNKGKKMPAALKEDDFSCSDGTFILGKHPLKVRALIPGTSSAGLFACVYVIYERHKKWLDWYLHAMDIVVETLEYFSGLPRGERDKIWVHWSS
jgi:hypothetical protein